MNKWGILVVMVVAGCAKCVVNPDGSLVLEAGLNSACSVCLPDRTPSPLVIRRYAPVEIPTPPPETPVVPVIYPGCATVQAGGIGTVIWGALAAVAVGLGL